MSPSEQKSLNDRLLIACVGSNANIELIKTLLGKGADPNAKNEDGRTPADLANSSEIKTLLAFAGCAREADELAAEVPEPAKTANRRRV